MLLEDCPSAPAAALAGRMPVMNAVGKLHNPNASDILGMILHTTDVRESCEELLRERLFENTSPHNYRERALCRTPLHTNIVSEPCGE